MNVIFKNAGEIDSRAFSSFGINVKPNHASPIGYFGTGLKYAIAVLLREHQSVTVLSGLTTIKFFLADGDFRGKEFQFVNMQVGDKPAVELGFTTELGKNWQMWMAYREIACNCIDEAGADYTDSAMPEPEVGATYFVVSGEAFANEHFKRGEILLSGDPFFETDKVAFHSGASSRGFYRGVRVQEAKPSLYTYNLKSQTALTEDRTLADPIAIRHQVMIAMLEHMHDEDVLEKALLANDDFFESDLDFAGWGRHPSATFLATVARLVANKYTQINPSALRVWKETVRSDLKPEAFEPSRIQVQALAKAIAFCHKIGFAVDQYPIHCVNALGEGVLGMASEEQIFITERVFHQGVKQLASTLIEEYIHLNNGYRDCSVEMQTYLFDRIVSMGEELTGELL